MHISRNYLVMQRCTHKRYSPGLEHPKSAPRANPSGPRARSRRSAEFFPFGFFAFCSH